MIEKKVILKELKSLIDSINILKSQKAFSSKRTCWVALTSDLLEKIFGIDSRYFRAFISYSWQKEGKFIIGGPYDREGSMNPQGEIEREDRKAYLEQLESAKGLLEAAYISIENERNINNLYKSEEKFNASNLNIKVVNLAEKLLRKTIREKPANEKVIQDAFEDLLIGAEIIYSRETESIEYSSKTYKPDFVVKDIQLPNKIQCTKK
jgi:hypothetical protein